LRLRLPFPSVRLGILAFDEPESGKRSEPLALLQVLLQQRLSQDTTQDTGHKTRWETTKAPWNFKLAKINRKLNFVASRAE